MCVVLVLYLLIPSYIPVELFALRRLLMPDIYVLSYVSIIYVYRSSCFFDLRFRFGHLICSPDPILQYIYIIYIICTYVYILYDFINDLFQLALNLIAKE